MKWILLSIYLFTWFSFSYKKTNELQHISWWFSFLSSIVRLKQVLVNATKWIANIDINWFWVLVNFFSRLSMFPTSCCWVEPELEETWLVLTSWYLALNMEDNHVTCSICQHCALGSCSVCRIIHFYILVVFWDSLKAWNFLMQQMPCYWKFSPHVEH